MNRDVDIAHKVEKNLRQSAMLGVLLILVLPLFTVVMALITYNAYTFQQREKAYYACLEVHKALSEKERIYLTCHLN